MAAMTDWVMRGHAKASIIFGDPIWAAQSYEMDLGQRPLGQFDPPLPDIFVDQELGRRGRLAALGVEIRALRGRRDEASDAIADTSSTSRGNCGRRRSPARRTFDGRMIMASDAPARLGGPRVRATARRSPRAALR